jgi:hypothetical protein
MQAYENIRPKLNTGDIVLFSGKGGIKSFYFAVTS